MLGFIWEADVLKKLLPVLLSILIGFIFGGIILKLVHISPFEAYAVMWGGIFGKASYLGYAIVKSTPLILTGLSVAFAFRTGLFNIGAEGQFIMGTIVAAWCGYSFHFSPWLQIPLILFMAMLASAFWGGLAGFFKARFGVHEVISTIMLNWIVFYLHNFVVMMEGLHKPDTETTFPIQAEGSLTFLEQWKYSDAGIAWFETHPWLSDFFRSPVNAGIFFALMSALVIAFILKKTTLGFELRAVGFNKEAALYNGINVKKNMIVSMGISGALAGLAGATHVMGVSHNLAILASMEGYGFDGIAVSLIGANSPLGTVFAGLFFGALKYSGGKLQSALEAPSEIISIMIGLIIFFAALPKLFEMCGSGLKNIFTKSNKEKDHA